MTQLRLGRGFDLVFAGLRGHRSAVPEPILDEAWPPSRNPRVARPASPRSASSCPTAPASTCSTMPRARSSTSARRSRSRSGSASHFSNPVTRGAFQMVDAIDSVDFILVSSETEALLVEQNFIKQYQPRFNIRLRDDKSYPVHRDLDGRGLPAGLLHPRAPSQDAPVLRPLLERQAHALDAGDARARSSSTAPATAPSPAAARGSPCLDYYIKRCGAPCVDYGVDRERVHGVDRRRPRVPVGPLPRDRARPRGADEGGRRRAGVRAGGAGAQPPARRAVAAAAPARRQRRARHASTSSPSPSTAPTPTPRSSSCATACSPTASRSTSTTSRKAAIGEVAAGVPAAVLRRGDRHPAAGHRPGRRRGPRAAGRAARPSAAAPTSRSAPPSAATRRGCWTWPSATRAWRSTRSA